MSSVSAYSIPYDSSEAKINFKRRLGEEDKYIKEPGDCIKSDGSSASLIGGVSKEDKSLE